MNARPTLQQLLEIQQHFGLPSPALVEKDWHVVKALAAIAATDAAPFRLVFGGGTALRERITKALLQAGFLFDPANPAHRTTMYEGRYTIFRLPYAPIAEGKGALRPEIQIETAVFPFRRAAGQNLRR